MPVTLANRKMGHKLTQRKETIKTKTYNLNVDRLGHPPAALKKTARKLK
jgi:hypothetical protein